MLRPALGLAALLVLPAAAHAGKCDAHASKATSAKGAALVSAFKSLVACDKGEAEMAYDEFMKGSGDVGTLVDLSLTAIDGKLFTPVWNMMEKVPDYSARDEIAKGVGEACGDHADVVPFLKGAYFGLGAVPFGQWDDALVSCSGGDMNSWIESVVSKPPTSSYDEKYNTMLKAYVKRQRGDALPALSKAAIAAGTNGGPFAAILEKMNEAVQPTGFGETLSDADRKRLEDSLVEVANNVSAENASQVADRLFNAGAESAAASLLPAVYPDRVQGGRLTYGVASVESCDKQAFIHYAVVTDPAKRWSILADIEKPLRAYKPKLKCTTEGPWPILATEEPLMSKAGVADWVKEQTGKWEGNGFEVKSKEEKAIDLN